MSSDFAIRVDGVSKHYLMFDKPEDRLKQMLLPRLQRLARREPKRYYRDFAALHGVSFEIKRGETVGIIGRNGSGKSTLLQIICGTLQPTSGTVEVNGRIAALLELGAGFNPEFSGRENVFLNAAILGLSRQETEARFDDIARFADIGMFIDQPVKTYSSGMYVRLAFATAINVDPDILVVDEALSVGDEAFQRKCFARIEDIKDKGGTILFVSHGAQTIVQLCDRAMLIDRGEKILEGRPKVVVSQYQRLVHLSGPAAELIRESIREMDGRAALPPPEQSNPQRLERRDSSLEFYDPNLKTQSRIDVGMEAGRIEEARIVNADGHSVNVLVPGQRYWFRYRAVLEQACEDASFGFALKTVSGLHLSGFTSRDFGRERSKFPAGSQIDVSIGWHCCFQPGLYFFNAGVGDRVGDDEVVLHRAIDIIAFRVAAANLGGQNGIVDVKPDIEINLRQQLTNALSGTAC